MSQATHTQGQTELWAWRHPRPQGAAGRCVGRTDLPVDPRRAKRLAHRIRQTARRHGLPHRVCTSHLQRAADVGRWLRQWGWQHHVHPALAEMDFGAWDGLAWPAIAQQQVDAWCADFLHHAPGGGEPLHALFDRVQTAVTTLCADTVQGPCLIVSHGGWMLACGWLASGRPRPTRADQWPAAPGYSACQRFQLVAGANFNEVRA